MSMKTWRQEFYPISISELDIEAMSDAELVAHSLQKWQGLTRGNLEKHGLVRVNSAIRPVDAIPEAEVSFFIDGDSCALCAAYANGCDKCPLYHARGRAACDTADVSTDPTIKGEIVAPYQQFTRYGRPAAMIEWLRKTAKACA